MAIEDPEKTVLDLLVKGWNASNTFELQPTLSFGWYDEDSLPQVTLSQPEENPTGGGDAPFSGIDPGGGGPTQTIAGVVPVHAWATRPATKRSAATTSNARQYNMAALREVQRIVRDNASRPTNPETGAQDLNWIAPGSISPAPEGDETPVVFHYVVNVAFGYGPV
jgi:hypothetical protein